MAGLPPFAQSGNPSHQRYRVNKKLLAVIPAFEKRAGSASAGIQGCQARRRLWTPASERVKESGVSPFLVTPAHAGVQQLIEKPGFPLPRE